LSDEPASGGDPGGGGKPSGSPAGDEESHEREPAWTRLIAPLRSEDAAFRLVVWAACAALALAAVVLLVRLVS
jgi:hypothetical protein